MTRVQARREVLLLSDGTIAHLTGKHTYDEISEVCRTWIKRIDELADEVLAGCENWIDVYELIKD